ncbi:LEA type 2 family protein [Vibrio sp. RC27]
MFVWKSLVIATIVLLSGCTNVLKLQDLEVDLINIEPVSMTGLSPRFAIELSVLNPNAQDFEINGVNMQLNIANQKIFTGVSNQIPQLIAYSETPVTIEANVNLVETYKLFAYLSQHMNDDIKYLLTTTIDPKGFVSFNVNNEGILNEELIQDLMGKKQ